MNSSAPSSGSPSPAKSPVSAPAEPVGGYEPGEGLPPPPPADSGVGPDLLVYARVLLAYWWILAPLAVIGGALGLVYCYYVPPLYRGFCRYEIFENRMLKVAELPDSMGGGPRTNPLDRQIILLKSANLNRQVMDSLKKKWGLNDKPDVLRKTKLNIQPVKGASDRMVDITFDSFDPRFSKEYIQELIKAFNAMRLKEIDQVHEETVRNLREEADRLAKQLDAIQNQLVDMETKHNIKFLEEKERSDQEYLADIMAKEREINTQKTILESQFPFLKNANVATLTDVLDLTVFSTGGGSASGGKNSDAPSWSQIPEWRKTNAAIQQLEAEYRFMRKVYKPTHPKMIALQNQIDEKKEELKTAAKLALQRLEARRDALTMQEQALLKVAKSRRIGVNLAQAAAAKYEKLKAQAQHLKELYDKVYSRLIDASSVNKDQFFTRAVEGPYAMSNPVWPNKPRMVALGILASLALGAGLIILRFLYHSRVYDLSPLEMSAGVSCLAAVPDAPRRLVAKDPMFLNSLAKSHRICEAFRVLRTSIEAAYPQTPLAILVTSPGPGDGKTFTTLNLANVFAWNNKRVLLVDGDLRRASLRKLLNLPKGAKGLNECLKDPGLDWTTLVQREIAANVDFLPAGHPTESGAELLGNGVIDRIFAATRERYDVIVVDSSPVIQVVDPLLLAKHVDGVLLVTRLEKTTYPAARHALRRLSGVPVIGYALNYLTLSSRKYGAYYGGYYGGYRYGYGYYHGYYGGYPYGYGHTEEYPSARE